MTDELSVSFGPWPSEHETRHIGSFEARAEDGRVFTLDVFVDVEIPRTMEGYGPPIEGLKTIRTKDGDPVSRTDKGRYRIIGVECIDLTSDDPAAP